VILLSSKKDETPKAATNEASNLSATCKELTMPSIPTAVSTINVPFHGDNLYVVNFNNQPYVPMKPVVEGMGMDWASQFTKIKQRFPSTIVEITMVALDGKMREMTCLAFRKFPAWMASIQPNKVKLEIRDRVIQYQEECDDVLYEYWTKGQITNPRKAKKTLPGKITVDQQEAIKQLVLTRGKSVPKENQAKAMITMWSALKTHFGVTYKEISEEQFTEALSLAARVPIEGEFIGRVDNQSTRGNYNFPVETADPHDRKFGNAWMTPRVILDERNRAPELELLEALQRDGYDITGVRIRIHAMYGITRQFIEMQKELSLANRYLSSLNDIIKNQTIERGNNVCFTGRDKGLAYGGGSKRGLN